MVPVELVVAIRDELGFDTVLTAYGLTESCGTVTMCRRSDPPEVVAGTSGRAIPGLEVRIVGDDGAELPCGDAGEIVVRGYTVTGGYWQDPEATRAAIDADGWLHTGDIGVMDPAGNVKVTDRLKDMYVVGGFNAYPAEVEAVLRGCPGRGPPGRGRRPRRAAGRGGLRLRGPARGRRGAGRRRPGAGPATCWSGGRDKMANYKAPRHAVVVDALPMNASGKVLKGELRQRFARVKE